MNIKDIIEKHSTKQWSDHEEDDERVIYVEKFDKLEADLQAYLDAEMKRLIDWLGVAYIGIPTEQLLEQFKATK